MACSSSDRPATRVTTRRLFFALWPDDTQRSRLWSVIKALCPAPVGRPVPAVNLHVTLAFLGNVSEGQVPALREIAAAQAWPAADLVFDRLAWWPRARLLCLEASALPAAFAAAVESFHEALRQAGFAVERRPFRAHITVARNVPAPPAASTGDPVLPFVWPLRGAALVASRPTPEGSVYEVIERF